MISLVERKGKTRVPELGPYHSALYRIQKQISCRDTVWIEQVPATSGSPAAERRRRAELTRPLHEAAPRRYRAVLLRYADDVAELVVVAPRESSLPALAKLALDRGAPEPVPERGSVAASPSEPSIPEWGMAPAGLPPVVLRHAETADWPREMRRDDLRLPAVADAAMRLVLGRHEGRDVSMAATEIAAADGPPGEVLRCVPCFDPFQALTIDLACDGRTLEVECAYRQDFFAPAVAERFTRLYLQAFQALAVAGLGTPVAAEWVADAERQSIIRLGGAGAVEPPAVGGIHDLVAIRAAQHPERPAISFDGVVLTYGELNRRAGLVAVGLQTLGARVGSLLAVCLDRSADLVVALLAVLKTGAAYLPLDPAYPAERLDFIAAEASPAIVIGSAEVQLDDGGIPRWDLAALEERGMGAAALPHESNPDSPAYVVYTSGSTGRPKGVVIPHRNVVSLISATASEFSFGPGDVWTLFHSVAFDFAVWEIWGCLATGGMLVVVPYWTTRDPELFHELLAEQRVTVLNQTPSAFSQLLQADAESEESLALRLVIFGGETLDARILLPWFDRYPEGRCRMVNMFGITETTVHVTAETITRAHSSAGSRSVGRALPGWYVYVADAEGRVLPPGATGEIYVGGAGVATGYLNRPGLTAERFPPGQWIGERVYRSGDRGRMAPDGRLEHLGRLDSQVQVRGFRVELAEIRSTLLADPSVTDAAVLVSNRDTPLARIDAYVVFAAGTDADAGITALRVSAGRFLPDYMLPATIIPMSSLPMTNNGKLDTRALEHLGQGQSVSPSQHNGIADPADLMCLLWEELFGRRVGPDDDFFGLGGNSLLAIRLVAAARDAGLPGGSVRDVYRNPTPRRLTASLAVAPTPPRRRGTLLRGDRGTEPGRVT